MLFLFLCAKTILLKSVSTRFINFAFVIIIIKRLMCNQEKVDQYINFNFKESRATFTSNV